MLGRLLKALAVGLLFVGGYGCGGSTDEELPEMIETESPSVQRARELEAAGQPLTGSQRRKLEDAQEGAE